VANVVVTLRIGLNTLFFPKRAIITYRVSPLTL
jgi:hypothetical protein